MDTGELIRIVQEGALPVSILEATGAGQSRNTRIVAGDVTGSALSKASMY